MPFRLHVPAIPHTLSTLSFSHCAFTQKVVRLIEMMGQQGCEVIHYGIGTERDNSVPMAQHVSLMSVEEQIALLGHDHSETTIGKRFYGDDANTGSALYQRFNEKLAKELGKHVRKHDIVCLPFGHAHQAGVTGHEGTNIETGIGYPITFCNYRIFESYAWLHRLGGVAKREGTDYEWVIPNYFDVQQWPFHGDKDRKRIIFFGRIGTVKGLDILVAIAAERPDLEFVICGQGDPTPWLTQPNIRAIPPLHGMDRAPYVGNALAMFAGTRYIEPFCGVTVEANLTGTPALTSHFGAFTETIVHRSTGYRARTLQDWLDAVEWAETLEHHDWRAIHQHAKRMYSMETIAPKYLEVFEQVTQINTGRGWYTLRKKTEDKPAAIPTPIPAVDIQHAPADAITPVDEARWRRAQEYEAQYWLSGGPERVLHVDEREREQHVFYRGLMRIGPETTRAKRILDVGCGPYSIGLDEDLDIAWLTAVDPLRYKDEDEARYRQFENVRRIVCKGEELSLYIGGPAPEEAAVVHDEVWMYNLLQHVVDPVKCIAEASKFAAKSGATFRIFEWCNVPPDEGHPHVLTMAFLEDQLAANGWKVWKRMLGVEQVTGWKGTQFYAGVWTR